MSTSANVGTRNPAAAAAAKALQDEARRKRRRKITTQIISVVVVFVGWQLYAQNVNPILMAGPLRVWAALVQTISDGSLLHATAVSLTQLGVGFAAGIVLGIPFGLAMGWWEMIDWALEHYVTAIYATPLVALVPLIILWFGYGTYAKIVIVFLFSFFPMLLNTYQGVKSVEPEHLEVARAFGASEFTILRHVALPSSIPFITAGLNIAIGRALVGMIVAEFFTAATGLGALALDFQNTFDIAGLFATIVVLMIVGLLLMAASKWFQRTAAPWSGAENREG